MNYILLVSAQESTMLIFLRSKHYRMKIDIFYMIPSTQTNSHCNQIIAVKLFRRT